VNRRTGALGVIVLVITGILLASAWSLSVISASSAHEYRYEATITATQPVRNCTIILPLPQGPHAGEILAEIANGNITGGAPAWTYTLLEDRDRWMIRIVFPVLEPSPRQTPVPLPESQDAGEGGEGSILLPVTVTRVTMHPIATADPLGTEPTLSTGTGATQVSCMFPAPPQVTCYAEPAWLSADYTADPGTNVSITLAFSGSNSRWWLGWSSDAYREQILVTLQGAQHGWRQVDLLRVQGLG
jgi:hypothetical protein